MTMNARPFTVLEFRRMTLSTANGDIEGLFSELRLDAATVPDGLVAYAIRHGDDDSVPCVLERHVTVNYFGAFVTDKPLDFGGSDRIGILDWGFDEPSDASPEWLKRHIHMDEALNSPWKTAR